MFLRGIERLYLPVAHAEGKFVARDPETLRRLETSGQLVLRYCLPPEVSRRQETPQNAAHGSGLGGVFPPGTFSLESQRFGCKRCRGVRCHGKDLRINALPRAVYRSYAASPLDQGRGSARGRWPPAFPKCRPVFRLRASEIDTPRPRRFAARERSSRSIFGA